MVVIFWPAAAEIGVMQERIASPFRCTVQAPHRAAPQPNLVPVMLRLSRSAQRMGVEGSASTCWSRPLMFRVTKFYSLGFGRCCFLFIDAYCLIDSSFFSRVGRSTAPGMREPSAKKIAGVP
jgi:hypothetical protein